MFSKSTNKVEWRESHEGKGWTHTLSLSPTTHTTHIRETTRTVVVLLGEKVDETVQFNAVVLRVRPQEKINSRPGPIWCRRLSMDSVSSSKEIRFDMKGMMDSTKGPVPMCKGPMRKEKRKVKLFEKSPGCP